MMSIYDTKPGGLDLVFCNVSGTLPTQKKQGALKTKLNKWYDIN